MVSVGIDIAKDKHDCFILGSDGEVLADVFTIPNTAEVSRHFGKLFAAVPIQKTK